jgi:molybdopterin-guanine dinucleotide biosynthesis protein A
MIEIASVTGVVLAGGRGSRMGGVDKGLQNFNGMPLALHTLMRLQPASRADHDQCQPQPVGRTSRSARPCGPTGMADYAGPLAGFLTALERCETPWLLTVPCDTPLFPLDLVAAPGAKRDAKHADIAMAPPPRKTASCARSRCSA